MLGAADNPGVRLVASVDDYRCAYVQGLLPRPVPTQLIHVCITWPDFVASGGSECRDAVGAWTSSMRATLRRGIGRRCLEEQLSRDGVALAYAEAGSGAPPLLLAHCWCGDHTHLAPQFEYFGRTHRVVAVDLRGQWRQR